MKKIIKILVTLAAIMGVFSLVSCNNDSSNEGGGKRIWIGNYGYFSEQAIFQAVPYTDDPIAYFTIEASPEGAVQFIEGEVAGTGNAWSPSIDIDGDLVIDFSAKYTDPDNEKEVTITVTAINSSGKVVVSDKWSGKLSDEKKENFGRWDLLDF